MNLKRTIIFVIRRLGVKERYDKKGEFMRKFISIVTLLSLIFAVSSSPVFASSAEVYNGVSTVEPVNNTGGISINSTSIPYSTIDLSGSTSSYDFSGESNYMTLYTNYRFTGVSSYLVTVRNYSDYSITASLKTLTHTYRTQTIAANTSYSMLVQDVPTSAQVYVKFDGSYMNFDGYIMRH